MNNLLGHLGHKTKNNINLKIEVSSTEETLLSERAGDGLLL